MVLAELLAPSAVSAHARVKSSTPGKGEVVQASPVQVVINFTQDVQKVSGSYGITVEKDGGASVTTGGAVLDDSDRAKMSVPLQPALAPGRYVVNWKNVSDEDGDSATGAFSFYVQAQPTPADLVKDTQLEAVGAEEETPGAVTTPPTGTTPTIGSPAAATAAAPTASATAAASTSTDGGSDTAAISRLPS